MPHFGHSIVLAIVEVLAGEPIGVVVGARAISSRSGIGRRDTYGGLVFMHGLGFMHGLVFMHTVRDIDPDDPANIDSLLAFEWTQAYPHS